MGWRTKHGLNRRARPTGNLPVGIAEVRATATGFEIDFTDTVDEGLAIDAEQYQIRSYRRVSTPAYGGDDQDERMERIEAINLDANRRGLKLKLASLREGAVYEINVGAIGRKGASLFPAQAHFTMSRVPEM